MASERRNGAMSLAERKKLLIAQGAMHRAGISEARAEVRASLTVESFARNAFGHVASGVFTAIKGGSLLKGGAVQLLLPLIISGIAKLSKKPSLAKPVLRGAVVIGVVAAITRFILRKRKAKKAKEQ